MSTSMPLSTMRELRDRFTDRAGKALELSVREALQLGHNYIGTEHLLLGLLREGEGVAAVVLQDLGIQLGDVRQAVIARLSGYADTERQVLRSFLQERRVFCGSTVSTEELEALAKVLGYEP